MACTAARSCDSQKICALLHGHQGWITNMWLSAADSWRHKSYLSQLYLHIKISTQRDRGVVVLPGWVRDKTQIENCECMKVLAQNTRRVDACVFHIATENTWGAEGGRFDRVNENQHSSSRPAGTTFSCFHTRTHGHTNRGSLTWQAQSRRLLLFLKHHSAHINSPKYSCP